MGTSEWQSLSTTLNRQVLSGLRKCGTINSGSDTENTSLQYWGGGEERGEKEEGERERRRDREGEKEEGGGEEREEGC